MGDLSQFERVHTHRLGYSFSAEESFLIIQRVYQLSVMKTKNNQQIMQVSLPAVFQPEYQ
jgi:hypothetical protein